MRTSEAITPTGDELIMLAECIGKIGSLEFPEAISRFCMRFCHAEAVYLTAFFHDCNPTPLFSSHSDRKTRKVLELYIDVAYVLDPFFHRFKEGAGDEVSALQKVAPSGFEQSEYYKLFYADLRLEDECGFLVRIDSTAALFFSFGTLRAGQGMETSRLEHFMPVLAALVRRHWPRLTPEQTEGFGTRAAHLERAFSNFGTTVLSPREAEITRLILRGYSTKAIAAVFDNSPETIKVHRRRLYSKLGVESQGELLGLFIEALSVTPATSECDPLKQYFAVRPRS